MKTTLFSIFFYSLVLLNPVANGQSVTMINKFNNQTLTLFVDGIQVDGNYTEVSIGNHALVAKYSDGSVAATKNVNFTSGLAYNWSVKPPAIQMLVKRKEKRDKCTLGELWVNGNYYCKTLELRFNNNQNNVSSIPVGTYVAEPMYKGTKRGWRIQFNVISGRVYDPNDNFKMKEIQREGIQIHCGNYEITSGTSGTLQGCILVGDKYDLMRCKFDATDCSVFENLLNEYFDTDTNGNPNTNIEVNVTVQLDY
ncbi:MAG: hypothetical protein HOO91_15460 [Bacteroidales bacterium]|nr:hypothetical protein [Bacteroidales bacterium]